MAFSLLNKIKKLYQNKIKPKLKSILDDALHPGNHPHRTAFSMAIGMFIAIFIPMGLQVWSLAILLTFLRFNIAIATFTTLVSNPFTVLPLYYSAIKVGEVILGTEFSWEMFTRIIDDPSFDNLLDLGQENISVFMSGLILEAILAAILTYFISLKLVTYLRHKKKIGL